MPTAQSSQSAAAEGAEARAHVQTARVNAQQQLHRCAGRGCWSIMRASFVFSSLYHCLQHRCMHPVVGACTHPLAVMPQCLTLAREGNACMPAACIERK